ncbi:dCTP deaminase, partial [Vibrio hyugaensis]|uniref:dCTP deaminase n=1 Tax=Vibrio hyugaensis TaxID=1534743 RepID=UPI000CE3A296
YNVSLSNELLVYTDDVLDSKKNNPVKKIKIDDKGVLLQKNKLYLSSTREKVGSRCFVPMIYGRSSIGRLGLFVQITAPIGDVGFYGNWTLQLYPTKDIFVYPGMEIAQIMFFQTIGEIELYKGKYLNSDSVNPSKMYMNFK